MIDFHPPQLNKKYIARLISYICAGLLVMLSIRWSGYGYFDVIHGPMCQGSPCEDFLVFTWIAVAFISLPAIFPFIRENVKDMAFTVASASLLSGAILHVMLQLATFHQYPEYTRNWPQENTWGMLVSTLAIATSPRQLSWPANDNDLGRLSAAAGCA